MILSYLFIDNIIDTYTIENLDTKNMDYTKYSFFPISYKKLNEFYVAQRDSFWTVKEINFTKDPEDWETLPPDARRFLTFILAFFSQADGIVIENLMEHFQKETSDVKEAVHFYALQNAIEVIHNEVYGVLIETLIKDLEERKRALNGIQNYPSIAKIGEWMFEWMNPKRPLMERIVAYACVEGIIFSGAFCSIYWIKHKYKDILRGLCKSNEFIARDEALHTMWGVALYKHYTTTLKQYEPLSQKRINAVVDSSIAVVDNFVRNSLQTELVGMSSDKMMEYVKCTADQLLVSFGFEKLYNVANPFPWMIMLGLENKTNFFEDTVSEYKKCNDKDWGFTTTEKY